MFGASRVTGKLLLRLHGQGVGRNQCAPFSQHFGPSFASDIPANNIIPQHCRDNLKNFLICSDARNLGAIRQSHTCNSVDSMLEGVFQRFVPLPHAFSLPGTTTADIIDDIWITPLTEEERPSNDPLGIQAMNRNARRPKKANKGARPCSRASRRKKKEKIGKRKR
jgi:hypothetical protein